MGNIRRLHLQIIQANELLRGGGDIARDPTYRVNTNPTDNTKLDIQHSSWRTQKRFQFSHRHFAPAAADGPPRPGGDDGVPIAHRIDLFYDNSSHARVVRNAPRFREISADARMPAQYCIMRKMRASQTDSPAGGDLYCCVQCQTAPHRMHQCRTRPTHAHTRRITEVRFCAHALVSPSAPSPPPGHCPFERTHTRTHSHSRSRSSSRTRTPVSGSLVRSLAFCLLEKVRAIVVAKERHRVRQHPDVAAAAVVVRLRPAAILVLHRQDFVELPLRTVRV